VSEKQYKRPYLDTSVYLAAIKKEPGRYEEVTKVLAAAERSELLIIASTFVAAEVIKIRGAAELLSEDHEAAIDALLKSDRILWVELDLSLAIEARHLAREHDLKPGDATHLATAIRHKADVLFRYDSRFNAKTEIAGLDLCEPYWYGEPTLFDAAAK